MNPNNPFPYSLSNKRYHTFTYYLHRRFGEKCARIPLDAGFTCPNIDGTRGIGGCIYCLNGSKAASRLFSLAVSIDASFRTVSRKGETPLYKKESGTRPHFLTMTKKL